MALFPEIEFKVYNYTFLFNTFTALHLAQLTEADCDEALIKRTILVKTSYFQTNTSRTTGEKTTKIVNQIRQRLDKLLAEGNGMRGDLMIKALNYLNHFWNQLILYLKDGRYSIDRSSFARLLPTGRKNSLAFGSHKGAEVSVIYHTFIETCKMCGVSTLEYFKELFKAASKREQAKVLLSDCRV